MCDPFWHFPPVRPVMSFRLAAGGGAHAAGERLRGAARGPPPPNPAAARAIAPREGLDISSPGSSLT